VITLTTATNDFTGAVSLNNSGRTTSRVTDANAIVLGTSSVGTGTLTVTATGANTITQTGAITQVAAAGAASFTTGAGPITLTNAANNFTGAVSLTTPGEPGSDHRYERDPAWHDQHRQQPDGERGRITQTRAG